MKGLRRILRIPWTARKTNEWVFKMANVNRSLLESSKSRKLKYYGHMLPNKEKSLETKYNSMYNVWETGMWKTNARFCLGYSCVLFIVESMSA